jgi:hypothetical protein
MATDGQNVYVADLNGGIIKVPVGGGAPTTLSTMATGVVAIDSTSVYWTSGNSVYRLTPK